eukprot:Skav206985  [mRNA]  locus=scaffold2010:60634:70373:- [translate_table: standard]
MGSISWRSLRALLEKEYIWFTSKKPKPASRPWGYQGPELEGWEFFADNWNVFDYTLVLMGFNDSMMTLLTPLAGTQLARAFRVFRGAADRRSAGATFVPWEVSTCLRVARNVRTVKRLSGSVTRSMLTILQVATLDGWSQSVARPLLNFGTFNILVAVMVERIATMSTDSKELNSRACAMAEQMILKQLLTEFRKSDEARVSTAPAVAVPGRRPQKRPVDARHQ